MYVRTTRASVHLLRTGAALLLALVLSSATARAEPDGTTFFQDALKDLIVGTPEIWGEISVFPLVAPQAPAPLAVKSAWAAGLDLSDRTDKKHEYDLVFVNKGEQPVLMLGGSVFEGGKIERLMAEDVLLPPKSPAIEVDALTASGRMDLHAAKDRSQLRLASLLAPKYLRERVLYAPLNRIVRGFIGKFDALRGENTPPTLVGIAATEPLQVFCAACRGDSKNFPRMRRANTVGFITAIGNRLQTMEIFGSNELLVQCLDPVLASHAFRAAAVQLREKELGLKRPPPMTNELLIELRLHATDLLEDVRARASVRADEIASDSVGAALAVWVHGARGRAVGLDGRLVHAAIYPHDPFERALFADPLTSGEEETSGTATSDTSTGELERRARRGTLTPYERRLLERRRAAPPPAPRR